MAALLVAGCTLGTRGEGPATAEERNPGEFQAVSAAGGIRLDVTVGEPPSVVVETETNLLPLIETEVRGGTLHIEGRSPYHSPAGVRVTIVNPRLDGLELTGGSAAVVRNVEVAFMAVALSGGSELTADGSVAELQLQASGGSRALLRELAIAEASVDVSGGSRAELTVSERIGGSASGGSTVVAAGDGSVEVSASGGSTVQAE